MARVSRRIWRSRYRLVLVIGVGTLAVAITLLVLPKAQALIATVSTAVLAGADVANVVLRSSAETGTRNGAGSRADDWDSPDRLAT